MLVLLDQRKLPQELAMDRPVGCPTAPSLQGHSGHIRLDHKTPYRVQVVWALSTEAAGAGQQQPERRAAPVDWVP